MIDADTISDTWWAAANPYMREWHWQKASSLLADADRRVLVLGPGARSSGHLNALTQALHLFLSRAGFAPEALPGTNDPVAHRERAAEFPFIVALPMTVGSSLEVVDFARHGALQQRLSVVLPMDYRDGYFACVAEEAGIQPFWCKPLETESDALGHEIGWIALRALAAKLLRQDLERRAADATALAEAPSSVQARLADPPGRGDQPGPPPGRSPVSPLVALAVVISIIIVLVGANLLLDPIRFLLVLAGTVVLGVIVLGVLLSPGPITRRGVERLLERGLGIGSQVVQSVKTVLHSERKQ